MIVRVVAVLLAVTAVPGAPGAASFNQAACLEQAAALKRDLEAARAWLTPAAEREIREWLEIGQGQCGYALARVRRTLEVVHEMLANFHAEEPKGE